MHAGVFANRHHLRAQIVPAPTSPVAEPSPHQLGLFDIQGKPRPPEPADPASVDPVRMPRRSWSWLLAHVFAIDQSPTALAEVVADGSRSCESYATLTRLLPCCTAPARRRARHHPASSRCCQADVRPVIVPPDSRAKRVRGLVDGCRRPCRGCRPFAPDLLHPPRLPAVTHRAQHRCSGDLQPPIRGATTPWPPRRLLRPTKTAHEVS